MTEEKLLKQRIYRNKINNIVTKKYEKTKKGFLVRVYRNMKSRVTGIQKIKFHLYKNLEILDKELFYEFSLNDNNFNELFINWNLNNYDKKLTPSIDRINPELGYTLGNIRWITHSENSRLGALSNKRWYNNE